MNVKNLFEKLFFKDIQADDYPSSRKSLMLVKVICTSVIVLVFLGGSLFVVTHAISHYKEARDNFLLEPERIEDTAVGLRKAVFFTKEEGDPTSVQGILAYLEGYEKGRLELEIGNINDIPVDLVSIQDKEGKNIYQFEENAILDPNDTIEYHTFEFYNVNEKIAGNRQELFVNYSYGDGEIKQALVSPFSRIDDEIFISTDIRIKDNMSGFDFIAENDEYIYFVGDEVMISEPLFIPSGKELRVFAGQKIDLTTQAFIVTRATVDFAGDEAKPIRVFSSDGTGRGLIILQAGGRSTVSHTIFDGLDTPVSGVWSLTGAVTFYESDVDIQHSGFTNNVCEDGLNIIRSDFSITNSYFADSFSDAFDADFCTGLITDSTFSRTGNDAVDASGSQLEIINANMESIGDKGISGGEHSQINIEGIQIVDAVIGIASKDLSLITGENISVSNSMIGITLYEKKPEFGPAFVDINNFHLTGQVDLDYLIQQKSILKIDDQLIMPRSAAKESLLFEKMIAGEPIQ